MSENGYSARWADLLTEAVKVPGKVHDCYHAFHGYSVGNCFLAAMQCAERELPLGPIATYRGWQDKGRQVKGGEHALSLWMPVMVKERERSDTGELVETGDLKTVFVFKPRWFVYAQTDGEPIDLSATVGDWSLDMALVGLGVERIAYDLPSGNAQGYASEKSIAINPVAVNPLKTSLHETAHVILGHTDQEGRIVDGERLTRSIVEVEAEGTTLIVSDALGLPGQEYSRGYIQNWLNGEEIPEKSARRIFAAADRILKAGTAEAVKETSNVS